MNVSFFPIWGAIQQKRGDVGMKYKIRLGWMEQITPTAFAPAWMLEHEVKAAAEPKEIVVEVKAKNSVEAVKKAAEIANVDLEDVARIVVNGRVIKEVGDTP